MRVVIWLLIGLIIGFKIGELSVLFKLYITSNKKFNEFMKLLIKTRKERKGVENGCENCDETKGGE